MFLLLLFVFPDGRWALPWTRPVAVVWCAWSLLWFINPLPVTPLDASAWSEPLVVALLLAGLGSGLLAITLRMRHSRPEEGRLMRPVLWGFAAALLCFTLLWLASLAAPGLRLRVLPLPRALLAFGPYLLPWLALPLSLVVAMRRGLWAS